MNKVNQNYSFFLFCKLAEVYNAVSTSREYDSQFELLESLYHSYLNSTYNNPKVNEYRCMEKFLSELKTVKVKQEQEDVPSPVTALRAIIARIKEDTTAPELQGYMLSSDITQDCQDIAEDALLAAGEPRFT